MAQQENHNLIDGRGNRVILDLATLKIKACPGGTVQITDDQGNGFQVATGGVITVLGSGSFPGGASVVSVFGRIGAVIAAIGDYNVSEITGAAPLASPRPADIFEAGGVIYMTQPLNRPEALPGQTYKIRWPDSEHALYITLNDIVQDSRRRPFEVFINSKNMEHYAWTVALTRMISAVFRRGGDVSFVVEEMKAVFDPRGGAWMEGKYVPSLLAAIGDVIERHMIAIGFLPARGQRAAIGEHKQALGESRGVAAGNALISDQRSIPTRMAQCPKCGEAALIRIEGCDQCTSCDYSKCW